MAKTDQETLAQRLKCFLRPKSIAVVGGKEAGRVIRQCELLGFPGEIWPVNPNRTELNGRTCYASLQDLPAAPDAVFVAVPRDRTIEAVKTLRAMNAGGAVCYASGFSEIGGNGPAFQKELVAAAGDMPIVGPNCYGCINALDRMALWPDNHGLRPLDHGAAIITQSGNMGINFTMSRRGLPLACLLSLGNQAQVKVTDCLEALLNDDRVRAIGLHIEGVDDVARFSKAARRALEKGVPLVAFKSGRSEKGAKATVSHTSTLAGSDRLYDAMFARYGIARVHSISAFLETLKLLCILGPLAGNRIASLSCSGGEASMMADRADGTGLVFPDLKPDHRARVAATLHDYVDVTNPLDYHTFIWGDRAGTQATFGAMLSGGFDASMLLLDFPNNAEADLSEWDMTLDVFCEAARANGVNGAILATMPEGMPEETAQLLASRGVAPMIGVDDTLAAIAAAAEIGARQRKRAPAPLRRAGNAPGRAVTLDEWHSKQKLASAGVPVPEGHLSSPAGTAKAYGKLKCRAVLKAVGSDLAHKTELGAVKLNLTSASQVRDAARDLATLSDTLLIEEMVGDTVAELIIGISRDDQFGPHMVIGSGGVLVEVLRDAKTLLLPCTKSEIRKAILGLRSAPLLRGYRGAPAADIDAAADAAMAVAKFAVAHWDTLVELDINPLIVREKGKGAVAADALIRLAEGEQT